MELLSSFLRTIALQAADFALFNKDGTVKITIEKVPEETWKKFSDAMHHLGYDYRGAEDAKNLAIKASKDDGETVVFKDKHAQAFSVAVGKHDLWKPETGEKLIEKAVKEFGITDNPSLAGFIIPDGRMLDFSSKGHGGGRTRDHSEIGTIFSTKIKSISGHQAIEKFGALGNIRLIYSTNSIAFDIYKRPTRDQYDTIDDILHNADTVTIIVGFPGGKSKDFDFNEPGDELVRKAVMTYIRETIG